LAKPNTARATFPKADEALISATTWPPGDF
jgi:hypothetical protein